MRLAETGEISPGTVEPSFFNDCLLAPTSREHGHTVVTYNTADFERIERVEPGIRVIPPFP